jgi:hypothetical protein
VKPIELTEELAFIQKWVSQDSHNVLLITGEPEVGKKTLLCSFLRESRKEHPDWLHLAHFASITPIYSNILYKIMIQLRVLLALVRTTSKSSRRSTSMRRS